MTKTVHAKMTVVRKVKEWDALLAVLNNAERYHALRTNVQGADKVYAWDEVGDNGSAYFPIEMLGFCGQDILLVEEDDDSYDWYGCDNEWWKEEWLEEL